MIKSNTLTTNAYNVEVFEVNTFWTVTSEPPKEAGAFWCTWHYDGKYHVSLEEYNPDNIWDSWPKNAIAYHKIEKPEPYKR